jgi:hypothetical protein
LQVKQVYPLERLVKRRPAQSVGLMPGCQDARYSN